MVLFWILLSSVSFGATEVSAPYVQVAALFETSRPSAMGGEMQGAALFRPLAERNLLVGPRLGVRGLSGSQGAIVGFQAGAEANLWLVNALGPGLAIDFVGPVRSAGAWLDPGWRVQAFGIARFKRHEKDGAWATRVGVTYDSYFHWGFLAGVTLQFSGVPSADSFLLSN